MNRETEIRADERRKTAEEIATALLACETCHKPHEYRRINPHPGCAGPHLEAGTWADPGDGHAYRAVLGQHRDVAAGIARRVGSEPTTTGDTDLKATLATLLGAIETHDTDYPTRYGLVLQALAAATLLGYPAGIGIDHASGTDMDGFRTAVYIELPTGQISWHMPEHPREYDGHSTELKYQRCRTYADYAEHADEVTA